MGFSVSVRMMPSRLQQQHATQSSFLYTKVDHNDGRIALEQNIFSKKGLLLIGIGHPRHYDYSIHSPMPIQLY